MDQNEFEQGVANQAGTNSSRQRGRDRAGRGARNTRGGRARSFGNQLEPPARDLVMKFDFVHHGAIVT